MIQFRFIFEEKAIQNFCVGALFWPLCRADGGTQTEKNLEAQEVFQKSEVKVREYRNCRHIVVGTAAPEICPVNPAFSYRLE